MSRRKRNSFGTSCEQWRTVQSTHAQHSYLSHIEQTKSIELIITSQGKSMSVRIFSCARNATPANNAFDTFRSSFSSAQLIPKTNQLVSFVLFQFGKLMENSFWVLAEYFVPDARFASAHSIVSIDSGMSQFLDSLQFNFKG